LTPDFDGDNFIGSSDIEHAVKLLTQNELNHDEIEAVWEKVYFSAINSIIFLMKCIDYVFV
jgi:hypothetical protein